ncbi:hypothetical protein QQS21_008995 [Conoideocrella luteorostrata]|uniref:O-methyltransferase n=1 Tax=Conoideocrella luteorostrata TaxID=1105319 RepID=A0AAJ0CK54_9HYPO|nr:hypothetical protein QQS21_008995 [Conoideocrella luteorostrata]
MSNTSQNKKSSLLSVMEGIAQQRLIHPDPDFDKTISNSKAKGLPDIAVNPVQGQYLSILCQLINAKRVLEIGTLGGYSTMWFAKAGAQVTSIEISEKHRDVALENLHAAGLDANIVLGAALDVLPKLAEAGGQFDLVFIDADWGEQWEYFDWAAKMVRKGGAIYVDNVVQTMMEDGEAFSAGDKSLVARVGADSRVKATMVPTISAYKTTSGDPWVDGFLLAIVL